MSLQCQIDALQECLDNAEQAAYLFTPGEVGINWAMWATNGAIHASIDDIFTQVSQGIWGTPGHINGAPSHTGTHPTLSINDINMVGNPLAREGNQQWVLWGYKTIPEDGFIRDNNGNTGETGRVYCGINDNCCNSVLQIIAEQETNTPADQRGILQVTPVKKGDEMPFVVLMSDLSAFGGFDLEFSLDGQSWSNLTTVHREKGVWSRRIKKLCDPLLEGETLLAPLPCCPDPSFGGAVAANEDVLLPTDV